MRTWIRKMAHQKAEMTGVEKVNKPVIDMNGRIRPSKFATNWRKFAALPVKRKKKARA